MVRYVVLGLWIVAATASNAMQEECPDGNLLSGAAVSATGTRGQLDRLTDQRLALVGATPNASNSVLLAGPEASILYDLGTQRPLRAFALHVDDDDSYLIEGSLDGSRWRPIWAAKPAARGGLRVKLWQSPDPVLVRYVRIRASGGDGVYAVSEWSAYCKVPEVPQVPDDRWLTTPESERLKLIVATLALILFGAEVLLGRRSQTGGFLRFRNAALLGLGVVGGLLWWNLGSFNVSGYVHHHEFYHYYMGAKYSHELGYTRLYECTLVADLEQGLRRARTRPIRNLRTNVVESADEVLADPALCKSHFSPERWRMFRDDIAWFRTKFSPAHWHRLGRDHGYNATPVWELAASGLARLASPPSDASMLGLALLDPILLTVMWIFVVWAFGWQAACVALLWWGTNNLASFGWTGGGFLRQDWLMLTVIGIALVRRGKPAAGGFALTCATLLRVIPGMIVAGLVLKVIACAFRDRRLALTAAQRRFAAGCLVALALLLPLSLTRGLTAWPEFVENSRTLLQTPGVNKAGLPVILSYEGTTRLERTFDPSLMDPHERWRDARIRAGERRWPLRLALVFGFLILLGRAVRDVDDWVALVLGAGLVAITSALAGYYFVILLVYGLLRVGRGVWAAIPLVALAAVTHLCKLVWPAPIEIDVLHAAISLATVIFVALMTVWRRAVREP